MALVSILKQRCPRCGQGALFRSLLKMNKSCETCDLSLEREAGYYSGAMYMSYFLSIFTLIPVWLLLVFKGMPFIWSLVVVLILNVLMVPLLFRLSRSIWIHMDYGIDQIQD